ncbi:MAG: PrsW family intramembrane metalloprotease [Lachnospiraceae bacterium]|nr:PrsW family intramembrane metalloprotease [Lachnospiraceae bacterium]
MTILFWLAVLPGLFLIYRVYRMDKVEKEPLSLLLLVTILGMISVFPAGVIEDLLGNVLAMIVSPSSLIYVIIENFLVVALIEEVVKFFVLERCTWDNPAFDYEFDGIVYAICSGMGFAIAENIMYVFQYGFETGIVRALTAIPAHAIFAIFMGHYYGSAKTALYFGDTFLYKKNRKFALLVPMLLHGVYDFVVSVEFILGDIVFVALVVVLDIIALIKIHKYSRNDKHI